MRRYKLASYSWLMQSGKCLELYKSLQYVSAKESWAHRSVREGHQLPCFWPWTALEWCTCHRLENALLSIVRLDFIWQVAICACKGNLDSQICKGNTSGLVISLQQHGSVWTVHQITFQTSLHGLQFTSCNECMQGKARLTSLWGEHQWPYCWPSTA